MYLKIKRSTSSPAVVEAQRRAWEAYIGAHFDRLSFNHPDRGRLRHQGQRRGCGQAEAGQAEAGRWAAEPRSGGGLPQRYRRAARCFHQGWRTSLRQCRARQETSARGGSPLQTWIYSSNAEREGMQEHVSLQEREVRAILLVRLPTRRSSVSRQHALHISAARRKR